MPYATLSFIRNFFPLHLLFLYINKGFLSMNILLILRMNTTCEDEYYIHYYMWTLWTCAIQMLSVLLLLFIINSIKECGSLGLNHEMFPVKCSCCCHFSVDISANWRANCDNWVSTKCLLFHHLVSPLLTRLMWDLYGCMYFALLCCGELASVSLLQQPASDFRAGFIPQPPQGSSFLIALKSL